MNVRAVDEFPAITVLVVVENHETRAGGDRITDLPGVVVAAPLDQRRLPPEIDFDRENRPPNIHQRE